MHKMGLNNTTLSEGTCLSNEAIWIGSYTEQAPLQFTTPQFTILVESPAYHSRLHRGEHCRLLSVIVPGS